MLVSLFRLVVFIALAGAWGASVFAQNQAKANELATRYVALRAEVIQNGARLGSGASGSIDRELFKQMAHDIAQSLGRSSGWGPAHPAWPRVADTIERDLTELLQQAEKDPLASVLQDEIRARLITEIERILQPKDLQKILEFYESPVGKRFLVQHARMLDALSSGLTEMQRRILKNEPTPTISQSDEELFKELLTLFDETVRNMWAFADPGAGKDRSGLQAIPMMVTVATQIKFRELGDLWRTLSTDERREVLGYRSSAYGVKERVALYEAMGKIKELLKGSNFRSMMELKGLELEKKWRALVPN